MQDYTTQIVCKQLWHKRMSSHMFHVAHGHQCCLDNAASTACLINALAARRHSIAMSISIPPFLLMKILTSIPMPEFPLYCTARPRQMTFCHSHIEAKAGSAQAQALFAPGRMKSPRTGTEQGIIFACNSASARTKQTMSHLNMKMNNMHCDECLILTSQDTFRHMINKSRFIA